MDNVQSVLSLEHRNSARWNRELMKSFQAELAKNPKADLLSMFPQQYISGHRFAQYCQLSDAGQINLETLHRLQDKLEEEPEINILTEFPRSYDRRIILAGAKPAIKTGWVPPPQPDYRTFLDKYRSATVIFPLSEAVTGLLARHSEDLCYISQSKPGKHALAVVLKRLLWASKELWQSRVRGIVVKCSDDIVAKVIAGKGEYTEYTSMQYLAERAPEIPAPRPHGYIEFGCFRIIFMSYFPEITLEKAWPDISHEGKLSIQEQLNTIFQRLRALRKEPDKPLGAVCGEGVKELNVDECALFKGIFTNQEFEDLQFSPPAVARQKGTNMYVKFLRSLLGTNADLQHEAVFTHGDIRKANIMVTKNAHCEGHYNIAGIIDWEDSGFYPDWHECNCLTRTLITSEEDDWYNYLPDCISPAKFPTRWLVDRLWGFYFRNRMV